MVDKFVSILVDVELEGLGVLSGVLEVIGSAGFDIDVIGHHYLLIYWDLYSKISDSLVF